jgi:hypothetical protein
MHRTFSIFGDNLYEDGNLILSTSNKFELFDFLKKKFEPTKDYFIGPALDLTWDYFVDKSLLSLVYGSEDSVSDFSTLSTDRNVITNTWNFIVEMFENIDWNPSTTACFDNQLAHYNITATVDEFDKKRPYLAACQLLDKYSEIIVNGHITNKL